MKQTLDDWLSWQETLHSSEIDLGLDRIRQVAERLNLLSPPFPVITVAGTNGKGSSVAMLDAIYRAQGYNTGNYTSPHLIDYNERIKLAGTNASDQTIINAFQQIDQARAEISLSYFEFGTLAAMFIFHQKAVDIAILEVGLGGRLDAANLWNASLALITSIDIDHIDWLGDNREKIAIEKAGIMRKGIPVISGDPKPPNSIKTEANRIGAILFQFNKDFSYKKLNNTGLEIECERETKWEWKNRSKQYQFPLPALAGEFQLNNASTVIAGIESLQTTLSVSHSAIKQGLLEATAPGRLQILKESPEWLIDVAHNPHAAKELANYLQKHPVTGKTYALFSMLKDKDIPQVLTILDQYIDEWHIIELEGSRGLTIDELKQYINDLQVRGSVFPHENIAEACQVLKNISKFKDRVVAFGSFLVVSAVINNCNLQGKKHYG